MIRIICKNFTNSLKTFKNYLWPYTVRIINSYLCSCFSYFVIRYTKIMQSAIYKFGYISIHMTLHVLRYESKENLISNDNCQFRLINTSIVSVIIQVFIFVIPFATKVWMKESK